MEAQRRGKTLLSYLKIAVRLCQTDSRPTARALGAAGDRGGHRRPASSCIGLRWRGGFEAVDYHSRVIPGATSSPLQWLPAAAPDVSPKSAGRVGLLGAGRGGIASPVRT